MPFATSNTTIGDMVHGGAILALADSEAIATARVTYKLSFMATPLETTTAMFANRSDEEQIHLLVELEAAGARRHRDWAKRAAGGRRQALLEAAECEELNARTLRGLLEGWPADDPRVKQNQ